MLQGVHQQRCNVVLASVTLLQSGLSSLPFTGLKLADYCAVVWCKKDAQCTVQGGMLTSL